MHHKFKIPLSLAILFVIKFALSNLYAQSTAQLDKKILKEATEKVAKYLYSNSDVLDYEISRMGYHPPSNYNRSQWAEMPVIRKIEMVSLAANNSFQVNGGEKVMALLSQSLAQQYESVYADPVFQKYLSTKAPPKLTFVNPPVFPSKSTFSPDVQKAITKIAKYYNSDEMGGVSHVLTHHLEHSADEAYEVVRNSTSTEDALKRGLSKFGDTKVQHQKIKNIVTDLNESYESSRYESAFSPFTKGSNKTRDIGSDVNSRPPPALKTPHLPSRNSYNPRESYSRFSRKSYHGSSSRSFPRMKISAGGFGGVIFGSPVKTDNSLSKLISVNWIPSNSGQSNELSYGTLVFKYKAGEPKVMQNVLLEDVYAAYNIIYGNYDSLTNFKEGNGIGLASLLYGQNSSNGGGYFDYNGRFKQGVLLHPAVSNITLGWSLLYTDLGPGNNAFKKIQNVRESELVETVLSTFKDWKVTDLPLTIYSKENELRVKQTGKEGFSADNIYFSMIKLASGSYGYIDSLSFNKISPILVKYDYNYKRANDFAKVFSVFRYIRKENAKIFKLPDYSSFTIQPHYIGHNSTGVFFERPFDEGQRWKEQLRSMLLRFDYITNNLPAEIKKVCKDTLIKCNEVLKNRESLWKLIDDYYYSESNKEKMCSSLGTRFYNYSLASPYNIKLDSTRKLLQRTFIEINPVLVANKKKLDRLYSEKKIISGHLYNVDSLLKGNCNKLYNVYSLKRKQLKELANNYTISENEFYEREKAILNTIDSIKSKCGAIKKLMNKSNEITLATNTILDENYYIRSKLGAEHPEVDLAKKMADVFLKEEEALLFLLNRICLED